MEIRALIKGRYSAARYASYVRREGLEPEADAEEMLVEKSGLRYADEKSEELVNNVLSEIDEREKHCGGTYPFDVDYRQGTLDLKEGASNSPYVFLLTLSKHGATAHKGIHPAREFLTVCTAVAREYVGDSASFDSPRTDLPASFDQAINELCGRMKEGGGFKVDVPKALKRGARDGKVDIVAWRDIGDRRTDRILLFAQCAAGKNWKDKDRELDSESFCADFFQTGVPVTPISAFFIPHCVLSDKWAHQSRRSGILFDRCRISSWTAKGNTPLSGNGQKWVKFVLQELKDEA